MNILILGNGFDLAHGLPTTYKDFLDFTDVFEDFTKKNSINYYPPKGKEMFLPYLTTLVNKNMPIYNELRVLIQDNVWLKHFNAVYESRKRDGKDGWIDFESEISKVIQALDRVRECRDKQRKENPSNGKLEINAWDSIFLRKIGVERTIEVAEIERLKDKLIGDLKRLTRCLEIYLDKYVREKKI